MKGKVHYEKHGKIALLSIDNPPVNPLSSGVRQGLYDGVTSALEDADVKAIVVTGMHRAFIAGADINEFGTGETEGVGLHETIEKMEASKKPIIAAINGTAFGGGLEVALCCDYRIAAANAPVGLPEVKLGLLPGAGGTQRLPRLIGAELAVKAIVSGNPIMAPQALEMGIIDKIAEGGIVEAGLNYAREIVAAGRGTRKIRDLEDKIVADRGNNELFQEAKLRLEKSHRNQSAPAQILKCVQAAVYAESFEEGLAVEQKLFTQCMNDPQREALIHVFFAERAANKIPDMTEDVELVEINKASVIGAGTMGGGIAMCFANAGIPVRLYDNDADNLARGFSVIKDNYARSVSHGRLPQEEMDKRLSSIISTEDFEDLGDGDIVVEAVYENLDLKKEIFTKLDEVMKEGALLVTNTSGLDVDAIAASTWRPESVCGMHFFSPANIMRLLEVIKGKESSLATLGTAMALGKRLGKVSVIAGNCPGFIGNRMIGGYSRQANLMILEGVAPEQIDKVMYDFGFAMGPFAMADMVGLDLGWRARRMLGGSNDATVRVADALCELGRYGQKNGKGYYQYDVGDRTPKLDPVVDEVIAQVSKDLGFARRELSDDEILKRCIYPLVNIGAKLLEEGHALRASDIDTVYVNGYGFPSYVGGPMWYADTQGLDKVLVDIERFYLQTGDQIWKPAELIRQLVSQDCTFASLDG